MNSLQTVRSLPCWNNIAEHRLEPFIELADVVQMEQGAVITEQFKSATDFYLLCGGGIDHYVTLSTDNQQSIPVGRLDRVLSVIGWSGLLEPNRYTTQSRCSTAATLLRWPYEAFTGLVETDPDVYRTLLELMTDSSKTLLEQSRRLLCNMPSLDITQEKSSSSYGQKVKLKLDPESSLKYLTNSSFFQEFKLRELEYLAEHCYMERFDKGEQLFAEGEHALDVMVLIKGTIELSYQMEPPANVEVSKCANSPRLFVRRLSQPGHIVSWTALTRSCSQDISAVASEDSLLCCIPASAIAAYSKNRNDFSINLHKKLLHIIGSRLRATRALLISQYTKSEQATVCSLLHNIGPQLSIASPLHKVPYLLGSRATQEDSFYYIDQIQKEGSQFEKNVAGLCSDILRETRREYEFYKGLQSIYQMVVNSDRYLAPAVIRNKSAAEFARLFSNVRYVIQGEENLPDTGGHIFIMNHLISHPYHKLANGFEFALDTHFLSSMILARKYGDSGIRVVRNSRDAEYGHEAYYKRLGHIHVYTDESRPVGVDHSSANWREQFFNEATGQLREGNNIILCPEGTSYWGDQSPGPFKSGAFRLAAMQDSETLIVPVVVANFDKRLSEAVLTAVVKSPIKIRDLVAPEDRSAMEVFLSELRCQYKSYLDEARKLADNFVN